MFGAVYVGLIAFVLHVAGGAPAVPAGAPLEWLGAERGWVLLLILGVWSFDTGAFLVGRQIGRHKFLTHISPAKSIEGVIGGVVATTLVTAILLAALGQNPLGALILGPLLGLDRAGRRPRRVDAQARRRPEGLGGADPRATAGCSTGSTRSCSPRPWSRCMSSRLPADRPAARRRPARLHGEHRDADGRRPRGARRPVPGRRAGRGPQRGRARGPGRATPARRGRPLGRRRGARAAARARTRVRGADALVELATRDDVDLVIVGTGGVVSLRPVLAALRAGKVVATANKETLVAGGHLVMAEAAARAGERAAIDPGDPLATPLAWLRPDRFRALRDLAVPRR